MHEKPLPAHYCVKAVHTQMNRNQQQKRKTTATNFWGLSRTFHLVLRNQTTQSVDMVRMATNVMVAIFGGSTKLGEDLVRLRIQVIKVLIIRNPMPVCEEIFFGNMHNMYSCLSNLEKG